MKTNSVVQEARGTSEARPDARDQLARYLEQQPQSRRTFDKVMKTLELAGLALVAGCLAWAIYASINWSAPREIAAIWFTFPGSIAVLLILVGVHAAGLRAFPPLALLSSMQELVTGSKAIVMGVGFASVVLVVAAFWGVFAWGTWSNNWAILEPLIQILGVLVGVGAVIAVASNLYRRYFRSR